MRAQGGLTPSVVVDSLRSIVQAGMQGGWRWERQSRAYPISPARLRTYSWPNCPNDSGVPNRRYLRLSGMASVGVLMVMASSEMTSASSTRFSPAGHVPKICGRAPPPAVSATAGLWLHLSPTRAWPLYCGIGTEARRLSVIQKPYDLDTQYTGLDTTAGRNLHTLCGRWMAPSKDPPPVCSGSSPTAGSPCPSRHLSNHWKRRREDAKTCVRASSSGCHRTRSGVHACEATWVLGSHAAVPLSVRAPTNVHRRDGWAPPTYHHPQSPVAKRLHEQIARLNLRGLPLRLSVKP